MIVDAGDRLQPIEIKSGQTLNRDFFAGLERWTGLAKERAVKPTLIYGGTEALERRGVRIFGWNAVQRALGA